MLILYGGRLLLVAAIVILALKSSPRTAALSWAVAAAVLVALGGFAIARQPVGLATMGGRLGAIVVGWGFRAGQGRLSAAILISWLVWVLVGMTLITALRYRADTQHLLMILAWGADIAALFYVVGVMLTSAGGFGSAPASLRGLAGILVLMIAASAFLWSAGTAPGSRRLALTIAGGPPLVVGVGYGLFLLIVLTVGRNARWN